LASAVANFFFCDSDDEMIIFSQMLSI
jgi:hypothetical protein